MRSKVMRAYQANYIRGLDGHKAAKARYKYSAIEYEKLDKAQDRVFFWRAEVAATKEGVELARAEAAFAALVKRARTLGVPASE